MTFSRYQRSSILASNPQAVFEWHQQPEAIEELMPPWEPVTVVSRTGQMTDNTLMLTLRLHLPLGIQLDWLAQHQGYIENEQFQDLQVRGPFAYWLHTHRFETVASTEQQHCRMTDDIEYQLPFHMLSEPLIGWYVYQKLDRVFAYRHQVLENKFGASRLSAAV